MVFCCFSIMSILSESLLMKILRLIGAIYLDFGGNDTLDFASNGPAYGVCCEFVLKLFERYLNLSQFARRENNYKDTLLQYYHKTFDGANPKYIQFPHHGPSNNRVFRAGVTNVYGDVIASGEGDKIVDAEQMAAKEALKYYGLEVYSDSEEPIKEVYSDSESESL